MDLHQGAGWQLQGREGEVGSITGNKQHGKSPVSNGC